MAMCDLLAFKWLIQSIFMGVGIEKDQQFNIHCNVFEDNAGALALAKLELLRMIKTLWCQISLVSVLFKTKEHSSSENWIEANN